MDRTTPALLCFLLACFLFQNVYSEYKFCASRAKTELCNQLAAAQFEFKCNYVDNSVDCLEKLENKDVDFGLFSAEEALLAAADNRNLLVLADTRHPERVSEDFDFQMVAIVRSVARSGKDALRGKKYCNSAPASSRYWTDSVHRVLEKSVTKSLSLSCNENRTFIDVETEALSEFFGNSCRPGRWSVNATLDAKLKRKYSNLCSLCDNPSKCEYDEKSNYGNSRAALNCLTKKGGDIAFVTLQAFTKFKLDNGTAGVEYSYLCADGTTQPLSSSAPCTWVKQSWPAILAKPEKADELSKKLKELYGQSSRALSGIDRLKLIIAPESYQIHVLNSNSAVKDFITRGRSIPTSSSQCGSNDIKWCTKNQDELKKCRILAKAGLTHSIVPNIACEAPVENVTECIKSIQSNHADIVSSPSDYGFIARKSYNLTTVMYVEGVEKAKYLGLIVISNSSSIKSISQLKGKSACFPFFNGLGWLTFLQAARNKQLISKSVCTEDASVTGFFGRSCVPGAYSALNSLNQTTANKLCETCSLKGLGGNCEENVNNPTFGEEGALRCLTSGAGEVAFLNFHAVQSIIGGNQSSNKLPIRPENLLVLCKNDTIVKWADTGLETCSFTSVIGNEIVTRKDLKKGRFDDIQLTLETFEDWFSNPAKNDKIVHLFNDFLNKKDILLPSNGVGLDSTADIKAIYVQQYDELQQTFSPCSGGASSIFLSLTLIFSSYLLYALIK